MKSKNTVLLVVNPISGDMDKSKMTSVIRDTFQAKKKELIVYETTGNDNDKERLKQLLHENSPERVLIAGGDGTINMAADVLKDFDVVMGVLSAGSANGFAVNAEIGGTTAEQLEIALGDTIMEIDLININGQICTHIADIGMNAELIKNYENSKLRGKLGYFLQCLPTLFSFDYPFHLTIEANDQKLEKTGILLAIANAGKFGTGVTINPEGALNDGKFELVIFKELDILEIFKTINGYMDFESDFVEIISTHKAKISCLEQVPFQIDGQYQGKVKEVNVSLHEKKLKVAVPEEFVLEKQ